MAQDSAPCAGERASPPGAGALLTGDGIAELAQHLLADRHLRGGRCKTIKPNMDTAAPKVCLYIPVGVFEGFLCLNVISMHLCVCLAVCVCVFVFGGFLCI